jgi:hypothetical protein
MDNERITLKPKYLIKQHPFLPVSIFNFIFDEEFILDMEQVKILALNYPSRLII